MNATYRYWIFAAGAALTLASCRQDTPALPTQSGDATVITFNSPYTVDSRSNAMRGGNFETGDKVGVLGYCIASNQGVDISTSPWNTKKPFCTPDVFYNQELEYSGTGMWNYTWTGGSGAWQDYDPVGDLHPWANYENYTYSFFAYYPYADLTQQRDGTYSGNIEIEGLTGDDRNGFGTITLSGADETGDPTITYTIPFSTSGNTRLQRRWWHVPDFMLAYKIDHKKQDGSVSLDFRHIFSALEFEINNYTNEEVVIEELYFGGGTQSGSQETRTAGFYREVSVTGQQSDYTVDKTVSNTYVGEFQLIGREETEDEHMLIDFTCPASTTEAIPITYNDSPISLLFIPDENGALTTDNNESIYIRINAHTVGGTQLANDEDRHLNLVNMTFRPGIRNIFSINIIGNDFYIQMRSDGSWDDGGESDIVFE